jgi:hypothetical protein
LAKKTNRQYAKKQAGNKQLATGKKTSWQFPGTKKQ